MQMASVNVDDVRSDRKYSRFATNMNLSDRCQKMKDSRPLYDKPPLPGKYIPSSRLSQSGPKPKAFDTFLNLSTIPKSFGAAHGATTLSAMRTVPGTLRGTQSSTVRLHPDFDNLHAFLNREHEIPRVREREATAFSKPQSTVSALAHQPDHALPSHPDASQPAPAGHPAPAGPPPPAPVRSMSDFADWEAVMERDLALAKRRSVAGQAAAASAAAQHRAAAAAAGATKAR
jgi:hypothetical protein